MSDGILNRSPADAPECEPYASFLQRKDEIAAWLRSGYSVKGVWTACRRATPPFEGSYPTFWRYCRMHELSVAEGSALQCQRSRPPEPEARLETGAPGATPKIWPRLPDKPREFIPRTED